MRYTVRLKHIALLVFLAGLFYLPGLGGVRLFDWDEINFAEISREMLLLGDFLRVYIDFQPFWEKPPFFFWLQAGAMHVIGVSEYAARLPNALNGGLTLIMVYLIGARLYNVRFGMFWAFCYFGSVLPFLYAKSGIIDPWFNLFIFLGLYGFVRFFWKKTGRSTFTNDLPTWTYLVFGGISLGFAMLTKGPVAFLLVALTIGVYLVFRRFRNGMHLGYYLGYALVALSVILVWLGLETIKNGDWFIREFTAYQYRLFSTPDAGHKGFFGFHVVVLLIGVFPASIFAVRSFFRMEKENTSYQADFLLWMKILFWVVLILFSVVQSKIVHYSSMAYLPITYMAAIVLNQCWEGRLAINKWMQWGLMVIGVLFGLVMIALPWLGMHLEHLEPLFKNDAFALANLEAKVEWTGWESLAGIWILLVVFFALRTIRQSNLRLAIPLLFIGTALFVFLTLIFVIKKVEGYSQDAAMSFFEDRQEEDCYVRPIGYKTYGHLFYSRKPGLSREEANDQEWLLTGPIDKPVYFITKINKTDRLLPYKDIMEIGRKNGFVFYRRNPPATTE